MTETLGTYVKVVDAIVRIVTGEWLSYNDFLARHRAKAEFWDSFSTIPDVERRTGILAPLCDIPDDLMLAVAKLRAQKKRLTEKAWLQIRPTYTQHTAQDIDEALKIELKKRRLSIDDFVEQLQSAVCYKNGQLEKLDYVERTFFDKAADGEIEIIGAEKNGERHTLTKEHLSEPHFRLARKKNSIMAGHSVSWEAFDVRVKRKDVDRLWPVGTARKQKKQNHVADQIKGWALKQPSIPNSASKGVRKKIENDLKITPDAKTVRSGFAMAREAKDAGK